MYSHDLLLLHSNNPESQDTTLDLARARRRPGKGRKQSDGGGKKDQDINSPETIVKVSTESLMTRNVHVWKMNAYWRSRSSAFTWPA